MWAGEDTLATSLPLAALDMARQQRQPPGLQRFKAVPRNSNGEAPESAIAEITVTAHGAAGFSSSARWSVA